MATSADSGHHCHSIEERASSCARLAYTVAEAAAASGIGRTTLYGLMGSGELPFVKLGKRTLVRHTDLEKLLQSHLVPARSRSGARDIAGHLQ
jgi:excisionase family DNA binding protein